VKRALLLLVALAAGWLGSEALYRSPSGQRIVAEAVQHASRLWGAGPGEELVRDEKLRKAAAGEAVSDTQVDREVNLLRFQFADENAFSATLSAARVTPDRLRAQLADHLRALALIEKQIAAAIVISDDEVRQFYAANRERFNQPQRFRARHIFAAAPDGSPAEVIAAKQSGILGLAIRVLAREDFAQLAAEASEDEATKTRGGDLGYVSAARMPAEFMTEVEKLRVGDISPPIRSHLGFHIVELTDVQPAREMAFAEAEPEIALELRNAKRAAAVAQLAANLHAP
jgi:parvulin-like peptidyl-prolyl isomerase